MLMTPPIPVLTEAAELLNQIDPTFFYPFL